MQQSRGDQPRKMMVETIGALLPPPLLNSMKVTSPACPPSSIMKPSSPCCQDMQKYETKQQHNTSQCMAPSLKWKHSNIGGELSSNLQKNRSVNHSYQAHNNSDETMECIVCYERAIDTALCPCWHIICCSHCANKLKKCPKCRRKIKFRQKVFFVK